jgi:hypothetical protein
MFLLLYQLFLLLSLFRAGACRIAGVATSEYAAVGGSALTVTSFAN